MPSIYLLKSPSVNSYLFSEAFSTTKQRLSLQARLERGPTFFVKHFSFNVLSITNIPVFEAISTVLEDLGPMLKKLFSSLMIATNSSPLKSTLA
jgi:hypothetical protein